MNRNRRLAGTLAAFALAAVAPGVAAAAEVQSAAAVSVPKTDTAPPLAPTANAGAWSGAPSIALGWDVVHGHAASDKTQATIETDGNFLYVRFAAEQKESIVASQRTNNVGSGVDDEVWVDLWPNGTSGFYYQFASTPLGTHFQTSSENTTYEPTWDSAGALIAGGYTVTMKIPLGVIRGAQSGGTWRAQFVRLVHATGEESVWQYGAAQTNPDDVHYAGALNVPAAQVSSRPKPRVALYGLGTVASQTAGGSTSRAGADISVPVTPTASIYATIHPDFSNVELDQQTIAPNAYQRYYSEVRPFFTQAANFYNNLNCAVCNQTQELYTPAIPTPRDGYAFEGQEGRFGVAGFDAVGDSRQDVASVLDWQSSDQRWAATVQRVAVTTPTLIDDVTTTGLNWSDRQHLSAYIDYGDDSGTNVLKGDDAQRYAAGGGWGSQTFALYGSMTKLGDYYNPVDGFVQHAGIAGYGIYSNKIWLFDPNDKLASVALGAVADRYTGTSDGFNQTDNEVLLDVLTKSQIDVQGSIGSDYLRLSDGEMTPISQNGIVATYHSGNSQNAGNFGQHGSGAYPTSVTFFTGRFGNGRLDTWLRSTTMKAGTRGTLTLEADTTDQYFSRGTDNIQWFERLSYSYQLGHDSSFALGVRQAIGNAPIPNGGGNCTGKCTNLSFALHLRRPTEELYLGYGDPNDLITLPQAILKLIFYVGAQKGA
jgi:hypothetical protein